MSESLLEALNEDLKRENEGLRRDAARYRWIRQHGAWETEALLNSLQPEEYDELVDRFMAQNP